MSVGHEPIKGVKIPNTSGQDRILERPGFLKRYWRLVAVLLTVVVAVGVLVTSLSRLSGAGTSVDRARLSVATVERGSFVRDVVAEGRTVGAVSPTLYATAGGTVILKVHAGDTVTKGQVLASIESPDLTARLAQEEATLQGLRIDLERTELGAEHMLLQLKDAYEQSQIDEKTAQRESDRSQKAYELGSYPELQALKARDALEKSKFTLQQAKVSYEAQPKQNTFDIDSKKSMLDRQQYLVSDLKSQLGRLTVQSPVDGQVGQIQVADRANVSKDMPLLTVIDLAALEVEMMVPEAFARDLRPGMSADLEGDGHQWKGTVSGISPQVVNGQVATRVRFGAEKPVGLRQNQRLSVRILLDRYDNVLMVDRGAFMDQNGGGVAYLVRGNVAERHPIRLGAASISKVEILEGLAAGDKIVIAGADLFNNAQRAIIAH
jgi:HlyD family secretion protein